MSPEFEEAAKLKPLLKNQKPFASNALPADLALWSTYKEAKCLLELQANQIDGRESP